MQTRRQTLKQSAVVAGLLAGTGRLRPLPQRETSNASPAALTFRVLQVARLIAQGASNKETARQLDITERTVKAHVAALLEKCSARDRLQLSLIFNGVDSRQ
mgnify:CR=1 FL=1